MGTCSSFVKPEPPGAGTGGPERLNTPLAGSNVKREPLDDGSCEVEIVLDDVRSAGCGKRKAVLAVPDSR